MIGSTIQGRCTMKGRNWLTIAAFLIVVTALVVIAPKHAFSEGLEGANNTQEGATGESVANSTVNDGIHNDTTGTQTNDGTFPIPVPVP